MTLLESACNAALLAGKYLKENFGSNQATIDKESHHSIVTAHDLVAENLIIDFLQSEYPNHGILSEEAGLIGSESEYLWVIDPLDGSSYYARGIDTFSVSVALLHKYAIIAGVIYLPIQEQLYKAEKGRGASLNGKQIAVSKNENAKESIGSFGHRFLRLDQYQQLSSKWMLALRSIRAGGSCAMELCHVAAGRQEMLITVNQSIWDYAAGALIVTEAGGEVIDIQANVVDCKKFLYRKFDLVATNGAIKR